MIEVKRILCAHDFSDNASDALDVAIDLARTYGAELHVVNVLEPPIYFGAELTSTALVATVIEQQQQQSQTHLAKALERCRAMGVKATTQLELGGPAAVLIELSKQVDLIVMGTRGRTGLTHLLVGSVAERVLRLSHCPVLVVPRERVQAPSAAT